VFFLTRSQIREMTVVTADTSCTTNVLESALEQLDEVAALVDLHPDVLAKLRKPKRTLTVSDAHADGRRARLEVFTGIPRPSQHGSRALQRRHPLPPLR
jgi:hypothetical protein